MGVFSPDQPSPGFEHAGYGRFRFAAQTVNKWNCVFRIRDQRGIAAGEYVFRSLVILGSKAEVEDTMRKLRVMKSEGGK